MNVLRTLALASLAVSMSACAVHGNYPTHYTHMNTSANRILTDAVSEIGGWSSSDQVAIVNLDSVLTEDMAVPTIIQDALVNAVVRQGIAVVERDSDAVRWLAQEGSGSSISYGVTGYTRDAGNQLTVNAELMGARRYVPGSRYLVDGEAYIEVPEGTDLLDLGPEGGDDRLTEIDLPNAPRLTNDVNTATKILMYRIIDVSVREDGYKKITRRYANVVLRLRLVDAATGAIVWSGIVEDELSDEVPSRMVGALRRAGPNSPQPAAFEGHDGEAKHLWKRPIRKNITVVEKADD